MVPGRLVEAREADGRYTVRFAFDKPAREVPMFAGPYVVGETMRGGIRLRHYIDIFSSRIGPYPHDEFHWWRVPCR